MEETRSYDRSTLARGLSICMQKSGCDGGPAGHTSWTRYPYMIQRGANVLDGVYMESCILWSVGDTCETKINIKIITHLPSKRHCHLMYESHGPLMVSNAQRAPFIRYHTPMRRRRTRLSHHKRNKPVNCHRPLQFCISLTGCQTKRHDDP